MNSLTIKTSNRRRSPAIGAAVSLCKLARLTVVILASAICALAPSAVGAGEAPKPPAANDSHLRALSKAELKALLTIKQWRRRFTVDSIACHKAFLQTRKRGLEKREKEEELSVREQVAVRADAAPGGRKWVETCLRVDKKWSFEPAGTTDQFGNVEIKRPKKNLRGKLGEAAAEEDRRVTVVHESSHAESRKHDAKQLGLDFERWRRWDPVRLKLTELTKNSMLSLAEIKYAIADFADFQFKKAPWKVTEARLALQNIRKKMTAEELDLVQWAHRNDKKIDTIWKWALNPERWANEEVREYSHELAFMDKRIGKVCGLLGGQGAGCKKSATAPKPPPKKKPKIKCKRRGLVGGLECVKEKMGGN